MITEIQTGLRAMETVKGAEPRSTAKHSAESFSKTFDDQEPKPEELEEPAVKDDCESVSAENPEPAAQRSPVQTPQTGGQMAAFAAELTLGLTPPTSEPTDQVDTITTATPAPATDTPTGPEKPDRGPEEAGKSASAPGIAIASENPGERKAVGRTALQPAPDPQVGAPDAPIAPDRRGAAEREAEGEAPDRPVQAAEHAPPPKTAPLTESTQTQEELVVPVDDTEPAEEPQETETAKPARGEPAEVPRTTAATATLQAWATAYAKGNDGLDTDPAQSDLEMAEVDPGALGEQPRLNGDRLIVDSRSNTTPAVEAARVTTQVASALAADIRKAQDGGIEVAISPEELGRVRLNLQSGAEGLTVAIHADRAETLELLRRNVDLLSRELIELGYNGTAFTFHHGKPAPEKPDKSPQSQPVEIATPAIAATPIHSATQITTSLDLRL